jgi:hypothetical protein
LFSRCQGGYESMLSYKRGCRICHMYQRHPGISVQMWQDKEWGTNMGQSHSPTSLTEWSPKILLLSVYTQIQEGSSGKASDQTIICRHSIIPWQWPNYECIQGWLAGLRRIQPILLVPNEPRLINNHSSNMN